MKKASNHKYAYRTQWSEEDQEYVALCAEFPSLSWLAPTAREALDGIIFLVDECLRDLAASGEEAPKPMALKHYSGKFVVRVPPDIHRKLAMEAVEAGVSLNRLASAKLAQEPGVVAKQVVAAIQTNNLNSRKARRKVSVVRPKASVVNAAIRGR